jgi:NAD(P)-dependent dehydrogenase (short-subunit alcohol dehydrogenase family)
MLEGKVAAIFAASGAVGSEVARAFARDGARVHLSARRAEALEDLASEIREDGGVAFAETVDAMDRPAVDDWLGRIREEAGRLDVVFNAIGVTPARGGYGTPAVALDLETFMVPIQQHLGSQFLTSRAAAGIMAKQGHGVILLLSASLAKEARPFMTGISAACAAIEGLTRSLAAELGPAGVRVLCLRPGALFETKTIQQTIEANARTAGMEPEVFGRLIKEGSLMRRAPSLQEVSRVAALLVSDRTAPMTGQVINASCGSVLH